MAVFVYLDSKNQPVLSDREIVDKLQSVARDLGDSFVGNKLLPEAKLRLNNIALQILVDLSDGQVILAREAWKMIRNFKEFPGSISITKTVLSKFLGKIRLDFSKIALPPGISVGLRFYVGKAKGGGDNYNIIAVPICGPDRDPVTNTRAHELDKEKSFFSDYNVDFYALNIGTGKLITNLVDAGKLIAVKDTLVLHPNPENKAATQIIYFSLEQFERFLSLLEIESVRFYLSRIAENDCLSIVIEGEDAALVYFDKGDLIPPPPGESSKPIDDTSF